MKAILIILLALFSPHSSSSCVILLHGLARTDNSMKKLESALISHNFHTVNVKYPSREYTIGILASRAIEPALDECPTEAEINFVTHSLGGILVRQYLSEHQIPTLNRVVMLAPPNQGSEVVDKLGSFPGFRFINGDAGLQLGTDESSIANQLGGADFDVGIIAGTRSINLFLSLLIPGTDDGKVSVERTRLEGMKDHIQMPVTHPFIMKNESVMAQVLHFLEHGNFERDEGAGTTSPK